MTEKKNIAAIAVTYHAGDEFLTQCEKLLPQLGHLYISDNGSSGKARELLDEIKKRWPEQVALILNQENLGVAGGQNAALRMALTKPYDYILLMDDDSEPDEGMVVKLLEAAESHKAAIVGAHIIDADSGYEKKYKVRAGLFGFKRQSASAGMVIEDAYMVIASGSLIRADLFKEIGLMREGYFIDGVDVEFCLRALENGNKIAISGDALLNHRLGQTQVKRVLGKDWPHWNVEPSRYFTIGRNMIWNWKLYFWKFPAYCLFDLLMIGHHAASILFFESQKMCKLVMLLKGIFNGVFSAVPTKDFA